MDSLILLVIYFVATVLSLPLQQDSQLQQQQQELSEANLIRTVRQSDNFGFPSDTEQVESLPSNSCFEVITKTYRVSENTDETINVTTRQCCDGYTGADCNEIIDPFSASNPCSGVVCPNDPEAQCAVINQCGSQVAIFLNELGQIVDCGIDVDDADNITADNVTTSTNQSTSVADTSITTLSCQGFCDFDPCAGQVCSSFPDAFCFQSGCDCQPIWFLDTGVQVNCSTGSPIVPSQSTRNRRQTAMVESSC